MTTVALIGAPNAGKSTLFNAITGAGRTVGNWPGSTVEVGRASIQIPILGASQSEGDGQTIALLDLPGAYSLDATSPDEELTRELLSGEQTQHPAAVIVIADSSHLARSLYLVAQIRERRTRIVVALTMFDVATERGVRIDVPLLAAQLGCPVVVTDPRRRTGIESLTTQLVETLSKPAPMPRTAEDNYFQNTLLTKDSKSPEPEELLAAAEERFTWLQQVTAPPIVVQLPVERSRTDRVDRLATAPIIGPLLFLLIMWGVFQLTTTVAAPLQDALGNLISGPVTSLGRDGFHAIGLGGSWFSGFILNGLVAGVGMLLTFVPLMAIMFCLLALLEDSGYLARAAVVTDRTMRRIGLPGKAFLPLIVGFGCNVPAISATRIMTNPRHRIMTALLVPFTSCSARLTVYVLVAATFFPKQAGTVVFGMYLISIALVVLTGLALKKTLWRTVGAEPLLLDLPPYQRPTLRVISSVTWLRVRGFLHTASGIIVATVTLVWLLQAIPVQGSAPFGHVPANDSAFASIAQATAPIFTPAGFGDWHTSSALIVGFVAKEAVISSWAQTYADARPDESGVSPHQLQQQISHSFDASSGGATTAAVLAFLIFLLAYTPCVATLAAQRREIGLRWTLFGVVMQLSIAWLLAVTVFQVGRTI